MTQRELEFIYEILKEMNLDVRYIDENTLTFNVKLGEEEYDIIVQLDPVIKKLRLMIPTNVEIRSSGKLARLLRKSFNEWKYFYAIDPERYVIVISDTFYTSLDNIRSLVKKLINYVIEGARKLYEIVG